MTASRPNVVELDRDTQVRRVVDDVLARRGGGEVITDEALCREHASLLPELADELRKLRVIERARDEARSSDLAPLDTAAAETEIFVPSTGQVPRLAQSLHIRCPLCHEPLEIVADQPLDDIRCPTCGGHFALAGDDPELGRQAFMQIAHFELLQRLGMGGFGTVWKARDTKLERTVALKIPRRRLVNAADEAEFLYEARIAAKLRHPHIVTVYEIGCHADHAYIASDLVEGVSLDKYLARKGLTQREAAELLATVCDALHFAHQAGIVHRDLKPGNILIDACGRPHITDFGLAKRGEEVEVNIHGEILGTPAYMAPEQARGQSHTADCRTDVYALGVILFELLTDDLPFRGNAMALVHHAIHTEPPSPRSLNSNVCRDLETICLKCLEKDPSRRYASAQELADELRRFLAGDEIVARPISASERLWRWCRKNPRIPTLSAALLAVVLVAYAFGWMRLERQIAATDAALTERAMANVRFTAESIAHSAGHDFERYFDWVEEAADDEALREALRTLNADPRFRRTDFLTRLEGDGAGVEDGLGNPSYQDRLGNPSYGMLYDPMQTGEALTLLRQQLRDDPLRRAVQQWVEKRPLVGELPVFAWFVLLPEGLQIARHPLAHGGGNTIGEDYSWRAYFHGGEHDHPRSRGGGAGRHLRHTHLSPPFLTEHTNEWVVVLSTPVSDEREAGGRDAQDRPILGVLGLMIRLGGLATLPGNAPAAASSSSASSFAVLVDSRPGHEGQVLQHPLYLALEDRPDARRNLLERAQSTELRTADGNWHVDAAYRDPFAAISRQYDQRWLAARLPLLARGQDTQLRVIVQESYDETIGQPLAQLRRGLIALGLVTLALSAAVIVPLWGLILRLVR